MDHDSGKKGVKEIVDSDAASESGGSSEEYAGESPRSVGKWRMNNKLGVVVHSQVLKIREEDSHLGEDMIVKDNFIINGQNAQQIRFVSTAVDVMLSSRLILPSSPLSGRNAVKASPYYSVNSI